MNPKLKSASIFRAVGSFRSLVYFLMVDTTLRTSRRVRREHSQEAEPNMGALGTVYNLLLMGSTVGKKMVILKKKR